MLLRHTGYRHAKQWNCTPYFTPYRKINSKFIKNLKNGRTKVIKLLEESTRVNLYDLGLGHGF